MLGLARRRVGRPIEAGLQEVDALLQKWGEETDANGSPLTMHPIARMMRDGELGAVQISGPVPLSQQSEHVDRAVKLLPGTTRRVITFWYGSADRFNRTLCLRRLKISEEEFKWRLKAGREQVAELLGISQVRAGE